MKANKRTRCLDRRPRTAYRLVAVIDGVQRAVSAQPHKATPVKIYRVKR